MRPSYDKAVLTAALPMITQANQVLLSSGNYYLAEAWLGCAVGCGGWTRERPGSGEMVPDLGHIRHFATHPDWIRRGIGCAVYKKCENQARRVGVRRFECYASLNGERFYEALGFKAVREIAVPMGQDLRFPSILIERSI
jgi:N-acetylglutamate synthase-like GNAT family acetyltransferase